MIFIGSDIKCRPFGPGFSIEVYTDSAYCDSFIDGWTARLEAEILAGRIDEQRVRSQDLFEEVVFVRPRLLLFDQTILFLTVVVVAPFTHKNTIGPIVIDGIIFHPRSTRLC